MLQNFRERERFGVIKGSKQDYSFCDNISFYEEENKSRCSFGGNQLT